MMRYFLLALFILAIPSLAFAQNLPPVADAGDNRDVYTGETVILLGSATDPDGDLIVGWSWRAADVPAGADWAFAYTDTSTPYFTANTPGDYLLSLMVLDSRGATSAPDYAVIHAVTNLPPVAIATADKTEGPAPLTVQFDGSQSYDPEGQPIVMYLWEFGDGSAPSFAATPPPHTYVIPGTYNVVILTVTDEQGANGSDTIVITVTEPVAYSWSDFLQPIDPPDANRVSKSVFKAGSTVPVKFRLTGASAGITDLVATLSYAKVSDGIVGTVIEAVSTAAATTGNLFRYADGQYIFNWSTKGLTPGAYQLSANLGDGVSRTVIISLK